MNDDIIRMREHYHDYRRMMEVRALPATETGEMIVEGKFVDLGKKYTLFEYNGIRVSEIIAKGAFDGADYRDVPLKYNHGDNHGTPARTTSRNEQGRMTITIYEDRVEMRANLLPTSGGKDLYLEVAAGTVPQMSWAFVQDQSKEQCIESLDGDIREYCYVVNKIDRVFDVAAVDFGANDNTEIYARRKGELDERVKALDERSAERMAMIIAIRSKAFQ